MNGVAGVVVGSGASVGVHEVVAPLVLEDRRQVAEHFAPLHAEAERLAAEIAELRQAARQKVWEAVVQTRELHLRLCDASARLEHVQLDLLERTGEVRHPAVPIPFTEFLLTEIRRFVLDVPATR